MPPLTYVSPFYVVAANIKGGRYVFIDQLLALESQSGPADPIFVSGFLPASSWEPFLSSLPDQRFASYIRRGIHSGFRIGFNRSQKLRSACKNHQSTNQLATQVNSYITTEVNAGKLKMIPSPTGIHTSPMGLIPKKNRPGKFRLIVDLSAPPMHSVNDGINPPLCTLKYTSVLEAAKHLRPGLFMTSRVPTGWLQSTLLTTGFLVSLGRAARTVIRPYHSACGQLLCSSRRPRMGNVMSRHTFPSTLH